MELVDVSSYVFPPNFILSTSRSVSFLALDDLLSSTGGAGDGEGAGGVSVGISDTGVDESSGTCSGG